MSNPAVLLDYDAATQVAVLTLNRPDRLNSITRQMHIELRGALDRVEASGARSLIITGAGRGFCAGQDLSDLDLDTATPVDPGDLLTEYYNPLILRLQSLPLPVIAAVNGTAAGAGVNLALACDLVLAARSAKFIQAFVKIGLLPDAGGSWQLPRRVGIARALGLAMTGEPISGEQAEQWGLIWRAVEAETLQEQARQLATQLAAQPTRAIAAIKQALRASASQSLELTLDLEARLQSELSRSDDYREGVDAFQNKRAPRFTGH
jgi:2-(1,2-epoxy-1,2-dihydrophenyl)acetyl-CoA isomerase